ncbi:MAG: hypothetical protein ACPKNR_01810 [Pleomorphochaeta sp.]
MNDKQLITTEDKSKVKNVAINTLLDKIRPEWKSRHLIQRVENILPVDPSSACQRIFNASMHDLKDKIIIAGLDIAQEAAKQNKLPPISKNEDIENYNVSNVINLAYRMGLLTRPEWKRILRVYDIRRDLEHEDDEYEATVEDCFYIFKTTIDIVLSKDPVHLIKLTDIKKIIEDSSPLVLSKAVIQDYKLAPYQRQLQIFRFLISTSLDNSQLDIIRANSFNALSSLREYTISTVIIECAKDMVDNINRGILSIEKAQVCFIAGILPYINKVTLMDLFKDYLKKMEKTGYSFKMNPNHRELLQNLVEFGGIEYCPNELLFKYCKWLTLCYLGEPSYGQYRNLRKVFYSNIGATLSMDILKKNKNKYKGIISDLNEDKDIIKTCENEFVARRYQELVDITMTID